jgi:hypothetical protein
MEMSRDVNLHPRDRYDVNPKEERDRERERQKKREREKGTVTIPLCTQ